MMTSDAPASACKGTPAAADRPFGYSGPMLTCPRCKRTVTGWPLRRPDVCSPADWGTCIRQPEDVLAGMDDAGIAEYEAALRAANPGPGAVPDQPDAPRRREAGAHRPYDQRCTTCHRNDHHPGTWQGHAFTSEPVPGAPSAAVITLADGEIVRAPVMPDGSYTCPSCGSPATVPARGEERPGWDRGCPNPGCRVNMTADQLAAARARDRDRDEAAAQRAQIADFAARWHADQQARQDEAWAGFLARAEQGGYCGQCLRESDWRGGRARFVTHRRPDFHGKA